MRPLPVLQLTDDAQIKELLVKAERATCLEPRPGLPVPMRYDCTWGDAIAFYRVRRYYGYPNPTDNGYVAYIIPRSAATVREALEWFDLNVTQFGQSGPSVLDVIEELKPQNS